MTGTGTTETGATGATGATGVVDLTAPAAGKYLKLTGPTPVLSVAVAPGDAAGGRIWYTVVATDGNGQTATESGVIQYLATPTAITCTIAGDDKIRLGTVNSACTPGFFNPGAQPGVSITDNVTFPTPAPVATHKLYYRIENLSGSTIRLE
jgi:hypothetical protein